MDYSWLWQLATTLGIGVIGYFLKQLNKNIDNKISQNKEDISENNENIKKLQDDFNDYKLEQEKQLNEYKLQQEKDITKRFDNYISRKEFITVISNTDKKLDEIYTEIIKRGRGEKDGT
ncbi:hypothetical protein [Vallitalea guaymasensis]|uniref:hypothetical protein n=1 Tax=Vallitalea guaymasensis TaxID=1185412 RepID=UPI000DE1EC08|nr:hypothetical protein [Vallitalea guaymasensis]